MSQTPRLLLKQLSFYGAYHHNFWNQVIHVIFVPYIFWGLLLTFNLLGPVIEVKFLESINLPLHIGTIIAFGYIAYYLFLGDYIVSGSYSIILLAITMHANATYASNPSNTWSHFLASQTIGWGLQVVVGHGMFEGNKPALFDSLFDSIVMAPLFTWYEVLFYSGFRADLKKDLDKKIDANRAIILSGKQLRKEQ